MLQERRIKSYVQKVAVCDVCNKRIAYKEHTKNKGKCDRCIGQTKLQ
jgi:hypothetical protein